MIWHPRSRPLLGGLAVIGLFVGCARQRPEAPPQPVPTPGPLVITTTDGLSVRLSPTGSLEAARLGESALKPLAGPMFAVEEVLVPDGRSTGWEPIGGTVAAVPAGERNAAALRFEGRSPPRALAVNADIRGGAYFDIRGSVRDLTGRDRAIRLRFTLPVNLSGWQWHGTAFRSAVIAEGQRLPSEQRDLIYLDRVGPRKGKAPTRSGLPINKLPYTVVTGERTALAMAVPVHEPRAFLIQASEGGLSVTFTLGLSPDVRGSPGRAGFRVIIYPVDREWGVRSAAAKYWSFFPELFASKNRRHGNYTHLRTYNPKKMRRWPENAEDFGFLFAENDFQWTKGEMRPEAAKHAKRLNLYAFHWRGPWYWFHGVPRGVSRPEQLAILKAQAAGRAEGAHGKNNQLCGCPNRISAQGALNSCLVNERGQLDRQHYPKGYGCYLMPMNMNPDLPKPNRASLATDWQYRYIRKWDDPDYLGPRNFAWDALDDWGGFRRLNFRREHFQYETVPLVFAAETGRLCILNGFTHWAFARMHSGMVRGKGGLIMCNCNLEQSMMLCGQFIDVFVKERPASRWDDERLSVERMLAGQKPICFLGGWQPKAGPALEATIRKLLLFGIMPGTTGREEQRNLLRKYMPILSRTAKAGWQPVPHARTDSVLVERFGTKPGDLYFAVANRTDKAIDARVRIDLAKLGLPGPLTVTELVERRSARVTTPASGVCEVSLHVKPGETLVLAAESKTMNSTNRP
jgi:hypothetical protein